MTSWRTAPDSQNLPAKAALAFVVSVVEPALYVISATRLRAELCPSDTFVHGAMDSGGASVAGMMLFIFSCRGMRSILDDQFDAVGSAPTQAVGWSAAWSAAPGVGSQPGYLG
jgi:hypothetical protein